MRIRTPNPRRRRGRPATGAILVGLAAMALTGAAPRAAEAACDPSPSGDPVVEVTTPVGSMCIDLLPDDAPQTVANFLGYVERGDYEGVFFHRSVPGFVIQTGGYRFDGQAFESIPRQPPVVNEFVNSNVRGTVAMAKAGGNPDSATSEWFVNLADNSANLDNQNGGFTVFGRVREEDMAVADAIAALPIYDGRVILNSPLRAVFSTLPLTSDPAEDPAGYGCFDFTFSDDFGLDAGIPFEVAGGRFLIPQVVPPNGQLVVDPVTGVVPLFISPACDAVPFEPCDVGTQGVALIRKSDSAILQQGGEPIFSCMTDEEVEASDEGLAARRDFVEPQVPERLVTMSVPEPGGGALRLAVALALGCLARGARRRHCPRSARPPATLGP